MFHVITGGSGSGKSAYAEDCIMQYHKESPTKLLYYIATMEPFGKEMEKKIARHRTMRAGKGFCTIECYRNLEQAADQIQKVQEKSSVLLECMSNLAANEFYKRVLEMETEQEPSDSKNLECSFEKIENQVIEKIYSGVCQLKETCENVVIVTNEVCSALETVSEEMIHYKRILSSVNKRIAALADQVTEVVYGIPIDWK